MGVLMAIWGTVSDAAGLVKDYFAHKRAVQQAKIQALARDHIADSQEFASVNASNNAVLEHQSDDEKNEELI
jgi:hypothetical protein